MSNDTRSRVFSRHPLQQWQSTLVLRLLPLPNLIVNVYSMEHYHPCSNICKKHRTTLHISSPMHGSGTIYPLAELYWLPGKKQCIDYKILPYVYKVLNSLAAASLADLIPYKPRKDLRSACKYYLDFSCCTSSKTYNNWMFTYAAPKMWNELPEDIWGSI